MKCFALPGQHDDAASGGGNAAGMDVVFIGFRWMVRQIVQEHVLGQKQIRAESVMLRPYNMWTRAAPFDSLRVGDLGDVPINTFDLKDPGGADH